MSWMIASACLATTFKSKVLKIQLCTLENINNNNKKAFVSAADIFIKMKVWVISTKRKVIQEQKGNGNESVINVKYEILKDWYFVLFVYCRLFPCRAQGKVPM